jgi:glycyl-tRNA synthetase beta chain
VRERQADLIEEVVGPPVKVAFDAEGKPTRAAESFAAKNGTSVEALVRVSTPKGEYVAVKKAHRGLPALRLLRGILPGIITGLSFPKTMYWVAKAGPRFVRPIRWIVALLGEGKQAKTVHFQVAGVNAGSNTRGHRVLGKRSLRVQGFEDYLKKLRKSGVEPDPEKRLDAVRAGIKALLEVSKLRAVQDAWLENWIVNSTECPWAVLGGFDKRFLHLPREILVTVMRDHQKYFAVEDKQGNLQPRFVTVLNIDGDQKGRIRKGHERVLGARFADAEFFWKSDQKLSLADRIERLAFVTYQAELGSYADKVERMRQIARLIVQALADAARITHAEAEHALRAIQLCKCDLTTQMVQEFTELQGVVGGLYATAQGEPEGVAEAIYDHYRPEGFEDRAPRSLAGAVVSLADKLDSVVGGFAVGQEPTGSSDPFALRRQGNAIVKVLVENSMPIALRPLVDLALNSLTIAWRKAQSEVFSSVLDFLAERLRYYLETVRGLRYDTVRAVMAAGWDVPVEAAKRAEALEKIRGGENFGPLSVAAKRIKNILAKSATASDWQPGDVDTSLLEKGPEKDLHKAYGATAEGAGRLASAGEYQRALEAIAGLRPAVDKFFDKVLVMAEDRAVRENRLRLLGKLDDLFSGLAQFAEIATGPADVDASTSKSSDE